MQHLLSRWLQGGPEWKKIYSTAFRSIFGVSIVTTSNVTSVAFTG
jgi:hypothetical protein